MFRLTLMKDAGVSFDLAEGAFALTAAGTCPVYQTREQFPK